MPSKNLSITDFAVSRAIMELRESNQLISASMIANHIGCSQKPVYTSLKNLKEAGLLKIGKGSARRGGFEYEYIGKK